MLVTTPVKISFLERLAEGTPLVTDGSIAAELTSRGFADFPPCIYNSKQSVLIEDIHRAFVDAGAELLQSNTEHANRLTLERYGFADKV